MEKSRCRCRFCRFADSGLSSLLAYYDSMRTAVLPANLIQAQRDCFGAHTYERIDNPGAAIHSDWL